MADFPSGNRSSIFRLILVPGIITLAVTLLRLLGELQHWSRVLFNPEVGGPWSIMGITWLAPIFGIYFAARLSSGGQGPASTWRANGCAILAVVIIVALAYLGSVQHVERSFRGRLIYIWLTTAVAALITLPGWPTLFKAMLAYGYAARIPVAVLMFFAFRGNWGTHYDALPPDMPPGYGLWGKYFLLGFFPQLIFWVAYTVVSGMLAGSITAAVFRLIRRAPQKPPSGN
jgi:hypothetical protein